jgi:tRNA1Val (adenine37-N6)-methyltransferase
LKAPSLPVLTHDTFFDGRMHVKQLRRGYRFSIDAVLLAGAVAPRTRDRVVDLGTGCGIIPMILAFHQPGLRVWGVELQADLAALAAENIGGNGWSDRVTIQRADMRQLGPESFNGPVDRVVANPPYRRARSGRINPDEQRALARHEIAITLPELLETVKRILKTGGRFHIIYSAERTAELLGCMRAEGIEPKRLRSIHSTAGENARLVLVEGIRAGRSGLTVSPPLVMYDGGGNYSAEVQSLLRGGPHPADVSASEPVPRPGDPGSRRDRSGGLPSGAAD